MAASYHNPVRSVYGPGCLSTLPSVVPNRAVLVTFPEARDLGLVRKVERVLGDRLVHVVADVSPNPDVAELAGTYEAFWRQHADHDTDIVALGGGSAIDTAKTLMVGTATGTFAELLALLEAGRAFVPARAKQLIAVPTTAGTGSEVTPWATIWDRARNRKHSLHLPQTWPAHALVDPKLMLSLPGSVTLQSGLDALSHALESIWNVNANPISDTFAIAAVGDIQDALPRLMRDLGNLELRSRLALAALKAGMAFSNTKTALAHSISYEMTLRYGVPHGIACSFTLPLVLERALGRRPDRDAVLCRAIGMPIDRAAAHLEAFLRELGVKTRFADYGVDGEEEARMIRDAQAGARGRNFIGNAEAFA